MTYLCSLYFLHLSMGKSKPGCMITWAPGLIMMLLDNGAPQFYIVLMEVGKKWIRIVEFFLLDSLDHFFILSFFSIIYMICNFLFLF